MKIVSILGSPASWSNSPATPIMNALARRVDVHTIYMCKEDRINRLVDIWGVVPSHPYTCFPSKSLHSELLDLKIKLSIGTARRLAKLRPDVVLIISWNPLVIEPLLWSRWSGSAAVMWSESTRSSGLLRGSLSTRIRRAILANVDGFVTNGSQASEYLRMLGVRPDRIVTSRLPAPVPVAASSAVRSTDAGEGVRFLYVGRLTPRKRPVELIRAFETVAREVPAATLTVVGQGELESEVRQAAARVPRVRYIGFAETDELASLYADADVLVLPALREVWGLVVNEALARGLFVITTDEVGSAHDLLDQQSGTIVPAHDLEQLSRAMIEIAKTLDLSNAARLQRARAVGDCTSDRFADDIYEAAELALRVRRTSTRRER